MSITDDGSNVTCFHWTGRRLGESEPLLSYSACTPLQQRGVLGGGQGDGWTACAIDLVPAYLTTLYWVVSVASSFGLVALSRFRPDVFDVLCCAERRSKISGGADKPVEEESQEMSSIHTTT